MRRKRLRDPAPAPASPMIAQHHGYLFKSLSIDCKSDQDLLSSPKSCDGGSDGGCTSLGSCSQRSPDPAASATASVKRDSVCYGCRLSLASSPLIASVSGYHKWHLDCLRCSECDDLLGQEKTCFIKNGRIYCREDYAKLVRDSVKCAKCFRLISPSDWVRKAASSVYHLACFACDLCQRQLSTGEQFTIDSASSSESKLLCKLHFGINKEGDCHDSSSNDSSASSSLKPSKTKRVRTTFTEEQLQVLQANFQIDSNPDGQDLERIASLTGLSKRVTQVWFQNSRARQKKYMNKARGGGMHSNSGGGGGCGNSGWTSAGSDITANAWSVGGPATDQGSHCSDDALSSPV